MNFCSLYSGSSGNSFFVDGRYGKILVDAGLSGSKITKALQSIEQNPQELSGIVVSHDHIDHTRGVGVLSRKYDIPIYINEKTYERAQKQLGKIKEENLRIFQSHETIQIEDLFVEPFQTFHDAAESVGFCLHTDAYKKVSIVTDTGRVSEEIFDQVKCSDLIVMESNHDESMLLAGSYPYYLKKRILSDLGHLSNETAAEAIIELAEQGLKNVVLAHLSQENNFPQLAYETTKIKLMQAGIEKEVHLEVAPREHRGILYQL